MSAERRVYRATGVLDRLRRDPAIREIVERARRRDRRYGCGDVTDFALFVVDENAQGGTARFREAVTVAEPEAK